MVAPQLVGSQVFASQEQLDHARSSLLSLEKKRRREMALVYEIQKKIKKIVSEKGRLDDQLLVLNSDAKTLAKKIVKLEHKSKNQKKILHRRLRTLYKMSGKSLMRIMFSSQASGDINRNLRFLSILAKKDHEEIKAFNQILAELLREKEKLQKTVTDLLAVKKKVKSKEDRLAKQQKLRARILKRIKVKSAQEMAMIAKLRNQDRKDAEGAAQIHSHFFFEKKGQLPSPVGSSVKQGYGLIKGVSPSVRLNHKGYRYHRQGGEKVYSVDRGKVEYVGLIRGYGQTVILNHGDQYYTVYAGLGAVSVAKGDRIASETLVGSISETSKEGLYFEVRHFSQPQNPKDWIRQKQIKVSSVE